MSVYGASDTALVLYTGKNLDSTSIRDGLSQVIGAVALLGVTSLAVDYLVRFVVGSGSPPTADSPGGSSPPMNPVGFEFMDMVISPGVVFFVGGTFALAVSIFWWYWRQ